MLEALQRPFVILIGAIPQGDDGTRIALLLPASEADVSVGWMFGDSGAVARG